MKYLFTLFLSLFPLCVSGQVGEPRSQIAIGINGGVALNTVGFAPSVKQDMHLGPTFGLTARFTSELYFKLLCAFQVELNYTSLGWKEEVLSSESNPLPDRYRRDQNYFQLPLLARLGYGKEERGVMGYLVAGPQFGFLFSEKSRQSDFTLDANGNPDRPSGIYAQYGKAAERKIDYGITAGLGLEVNTKIGHFMVEGRYYYGLGDFYNNSKKDLFERSNHGTITAKVTYLFDIRK